MCSPGDDFLSLLPLTHPTVASHRFIYCSPRDRNSRVESLLPHARPLLGQPGLRSTGGGRAFPLARPSEGHRPGVCLSWDPHTSPPLLLPDPGSAMENSCVLTQHGAVQMALGIPGCARSPVPSAPCPGRRQPRGPCAIAHSGVGMGMPGC